MESLKLNLGCGNNLIPGYTNVDRYGSPDLVLDLETFPWPWEDDSVSEIQMTHVLEHLGESTRTYFSIIQELYRICQNGAVIHIAVPHPRHDDFLDDPSHVRAITPDGLMMFSRKHNEEWIAKGCSNSTLAMSLNVDFEIASFNLILDPEWSSRRSKIGDEELLKSISRFNNVIKEIRVTWKVIK